MARQSKKKSAKKKSATKKSPKNKKTPKKKKTSKSPAQPKNTQPKNTQPRLLSGGNPQIPKADGDAPVQAFIAAMPEWKHDVGRHLDALIVSAVPKVRKAVRWNSPFYGMENQGWFLSFHCFTKYVKVTFLNGSSLNPLPPLESKQVEVRYLNVHEDDVIDDGLFKSWVLQASKLPGEELF